jgi:propanol-preferring alcohol dehydrogenase
LRRPREKCLGRFFLFASPLSSSLAEFRPLSAERGVWPEVQEDPLEAANQALRELKERKIKGAKVLRLG